LDAGTPIKCDQRQRSWKKCLITLCVLQDMLALKPAIFAGPFKAMLSSPHILKLGYAFKDDLRHLAASHPGQDARGCFDKVENFVDVGKLFHRVRGPSDSLFLGTGGLSAIASTVLGLPLDKVISSSCYHTLI
jgi:hypothetical protein